MVSSSLCPLCSSSACEFWNLSAAHHRSHFLLHPATQHPLKQTRQRYTQQTLNQPLLVFLAYLFVTVFPWHLFFFFFHHVAGTLTLIFTFQSLRSEVQISHPSVPSLLPQLLPLPPSSSPSHFPLCCSSPHQSAGLRSDRDAGFWWRLPDCQHISIHWNTHMHTLKWRERVAKQNHITILNVYAFM